MSLNCQIICNCNRRLCACTAVYTGTQENGAAHDEIPKSRINIFPVDDRSTSTSFRISTSFFFQHFVTTRSSPIISKVRKEQPHFFLKYSMMEAPKTSRHLLLVANLLLPRLLRAQRHQLLATKPMRFLRLPQYASTDRSKVGAWSSPSSLHRGKIGARPACALRSLRQLALREANAARFPTGAECLTQVAVAAIAGHHR